MDRLNYKQTNQRGFTRLHLSIVLVIIGMIIGGIWPRRCSGEQTKYETQMRAPYAMRYVSSQDEFLLPIGSSSTWPTTNFEVNETL